MRQKKRAAPWFRNDIGFAKSAVAGCVCAVLVLALIAGTNFAASRMSDVSAARSNTSSSTNPPAGKSSASDTALKPKSELSPVEQPSNTSTDTSSASSTDSNTATGLTCDTRARQRIASQFNTQIKVENSLHKKTIASIVDKLQGTGLLTGILNPGMTTSKLTNENARHQSAIKQLIQKETHALTAIHCDIS